MSAVLVTTALVVALVSVPSIAGITAMGLAGGDGEAPNAFFGILGGEPFLQLFDPRHDGP